MMRGSNVVGGDYSYCWVVERVSISSFGESFVFFFVSSVILGRFFGSFIFRFFLVVKVS